MAYKSHRLGEDDWEMGNDMGMDGIDDPTLPLSEEEKKDKRKRTCYDVTKPCGTKASVVCVESDTEYLVTVDGKAIFIGDDLKEAGLDIEIAKRPHEQLPPEYLPFALREGDNRGTRVVDWKEDMRRRDAERAKKQASEDAKLPFGERVAKTLIPLHYDPQLTGEFAEIAGIMKPTPAFWDLWKANKNKIKEIGFYVDFADDFDFYYVFVPEEYR